MLSACAEQRATEPAAPASSPASFAAPPAAEAAPVTAAPATPAAAPTPQGLDQPSRTESSAKDEEFTNLEAAERALNQAKSDLDRLALAEAPVQVGRAAPTDGAPKAEKKTAHAASAGAAASSAPNALCDNACRAFASLSRAASAVCRLDGDGGSHCSRAKKVVADSQQRVASCACQNGD